MPTWPRVEYRWAVFSVLGGRPKKPGLWQRQGDEATKAAIEQQLELVKGGVQPGMSAL